MPISYRFRTVISCLLSVSLCGLSLGLRGARDVQSTASVRQQETFRYSGFARETFPPQIGPWLRTGRYAAFSAAADPAFPIPALAAGYVPQGMCYSQALGCFVLAYYHPGGKQPSLLSLVDAKSGTFVKSVYLLKPGGLPYTGHAGAAAAWSEHLWVTSESRAWHLKAQDLRDTPDGGQLRFRDSFRTASRGGAAFAAEGMLWVGDYYAPGQSQSLPEERLEPESGNHARCVGYPLDEGAPMGVTEQPAAALSIQDYVQGLCTAGTGELLASVAFTPFAPAWLWVYPKLKSILKQPPKQEININGKAIPLWVIDPSMVTKKQMLAPMSEGICAFDGNIYSLYESAALLYRGHAEMYADFVFSMEEQALLNQP